MLGGLGRYIQTQLQLFFSAILRHILSVTSVHAPCSGWGWWNHYTLGLDLTSLNVHLMHHLHMRSRHVIASKWEERHLCTCNLVSQRSCSLQHLLGPDVKSGAHVHKCRLSQSACLPSARVCNITGGSSPYHVWFHIHDNCRRQRRVCLLHRVDVHAHVIQCLFKWHSNTPW